MKKDHLSQLQMKSVLLGINPKRQKQISKPNVINHRLSSVHQMNCNKISMTDYCSINQKCSRLQSEV